MGRLRPVFSVSIKRRNAEVTAYGEFEDRIHNTEPRNKNFSEEGNALFSVFLILKCFVISTVEIHLSGRWLSVSPIIRICLTLRGNFSRILQD